MSNVLFIQFYYNLDGRLIMCNGFSDTYDLCKNKGDFYWVDEHEMSTLNLPITKGTIYVSATFMTQLIQVFKWTKKYPGIKFVVGGPIVGFPVVNTHKNIYGLVPNLELTTKSVEEYFNVDNFSGEWKLKINEIPEPTHLYDTICFGYTISNNFCYWGKCDFCSMPKSIKRTRENWQTSCIEDIEFDGVKLARLNTNAITCTNIKKVIPNLSYNKNIFYDVYLRGQKNEYIALNKVFKNFKSTIPNLKFRIGIEFPSDRILKFANKGTTVQDILQTIKILNQYDNIQIYSMFIVGWPDLNKNDVKSLKEFINKVGYIKRTFIFNLFCPVGSKLHDIYLDSIKKKMFSGSFYKGYFPKLKNEQIKLNQQASEIIKGMANKVFSWDENQLASSKWVF